MTYDLSEKKLMKLKYKSNMVIQRHHFDYINITALLKIHLQTIAILGKISISGECYSEFNYGVFLSDTNPTLSEYYN